MTGPDQETRDDFVDATGWVVVDKLLANLLWSQVVDGSGNPVWFDTELPDGHPTPAGLVQRTPGGGINSDGYQDDARIAVTLFTGDSTETANIAGQVRTALSELDSDGEWRDVEVDSVREVTGPGRVPDPNENVRNTPISYRVVSRRQ